MVKTIKVNGHGVAYAKINGWLGGFPLLKKDNAIDKEGEFIVEEAPKSFKVIHDKMATRLGINKSKLKEQNIQYY